MKIKNAFLTKDGYCGMEFEHAPHVSVYVHEDHRGIHVSEEFSKKVQKNAITSFKKNKGKFITSFEED